MKIKVFPKPCECGCNEVANITFMLVFHDGVDDPFNGIYADCAKCHTTRFKKIQTQKEEVAHKGAA